MAWRLYNWWPVKCAGIADYSSTVISLGELKQAALYTAL